MLNLAYSGMLGLHNKKEYCYPSSQGIWGIKDIVKGIGVICLRKSYKHVRWTNSLSDSTQELLRLYPWASHKSIIERN